MGLCLLGLLTACRTSDPASTPVAPTSSPEASPVIALPVTSQDLQRTLQDQLGAQILIYSSLDQNQGAAALTTLQDALKLVSKPNVRKNLKTLILSLGWQPIDSKGTAAILVSAKPEEIAQFLEDQSSDRSEILQVLTETKIRETGSVLKLSYDLTQGQRLWFLQHFDSKKMLAPKAIDSIQVGLSWFDVTPRHAIGIPFDVTPERYAVFLENQKENLLGLKVVDAATQAAGSKLGLKFLFSGDVSMKAAQGSLREIAKLSALNPPNPSLKTVLLSGEWLPLDFQGTVSVPYYAPAKDIQKYLQSQSKD